MFEDVKLRHCVGLPLNSTNDGWHGAFKELHSKGCAQVWIRWRTGGAGTNLLARVTRATSNSSSCLFTSERRVRHNSEPNNCETTKNDCASCAVALSPLDMTRACMHILPGRHRSDEGSVERLVGRPTEETHASSDECMLSDRVSDFGSGGLPAGAHVTFPRARWEWPATQRQSH